MTQDQIHRDLKKHLRSKLKRALKDHVEICETMDIPGGDVAIGLAEILLHVVVSYFLHLGLQPQQFGQICHDAYKEFQENEQEREA
jgi:hypothetical protein